MSLSGISLRSLCAHGFLGNYHRFPITTTCFDRSYYSVSVTLNDKIIILINTTLGSVEPHRLARERVMTKTDYIRRSVLTTHHIDELPSIPTQSWVQQCANALCSIHPRIAAASLVCTLQPSEDRLSVYSSGACFADSSRNDDMGSRNPLALQDRCERLTKLGIPIPESALQTGIVAPIQSLLSNWSQTPIAKLFSGT